ncbi:hypothetical protein D3C81_1053830 [compost metagenome]
MLEISLTNNELVFSELEDCPMKNPNASSVWNLSAEEEILPVQLVDIMAGTETACSGSFPFG